MLKLTLKPRERVVVNGCVIRNGDRRQALTVENRADIVRESDLLKPEAQSTPVSKVYFLLQTALIRPETRDQVLTMIQQGLAELACCFGPEMRSRIMEAANYVSMSDYYKAMSELRGVLKYEAELMQLSPVPRARPQEMVHV
ncbi:flagellar biosynthesis repressor FlbT [Sulfitobacter sp. CW3]|jgi:flagellar protein FlbT|uniref:flagellar biosynthesis repressor FlbT n=1 Tax=unclassified Sulfitobacter TaxID=196795 RepID=UPI001C5EDD5B|nr:flagellar biosynthesis repressor FlbT [Sulfitobacter sp. CW3]MBW4961647.1 flagellar biosynthesis repressor FlbT [Sulfitobacter sp. CW3]|tara:strand:+ start:34658 stop:35083 length:426 start_codon:yes stop_codon:yes gene_type:complete